MKPDELRQYTDAELQKAYEDEMTALAGLKVKSGVGEGADQPMMIGQRKRNVARILTIVNERAAQEANKEG